MAYGNTPVGYEQGCIDNRLVIYAQSAQIVVQRMADKNYIVFEEGLQCQLSIPTPVCHTLHTDHAAQLHKEESNMQTYPLAFVDQQKLARPLLPTSELSNKRHLLPPKSPGIAGIHLKTCSCQASDVRSKVQDALLGLHHHL